MKIKIGTIAAVVLFSCSAANSAEYVFLPDINGQKAPFVIVAEDGNYAIADFSLIIETGNDDSVLEENLSNYAIRIDVKANNEDWSVIPDPCYKNDGTSGNVTWDQFTKEDIICQVVDDGGIFSILPVTGYYGSVVGFLAKFVAGYGSEEEFSGVRIDKASANTNKEPENNMFRFSVDEYNAEFFFIEKK